MTILALTVCCHFYSEHGQGHHRDVATPSDPASTYTTALRSFANTGLLIVRVRERQGESSWW